MEENKEENPEYKYAALAVTMVIMLLIPVVYVTFIKKDEPKEAVVIQQRVEAPPINTTQVDEQKKTAEANPSEANYVNLGISYFTAKRYRDCIDVSKKALAINPKNALAYNNMCSAYNCLSLWDSAIIAGNAAVAIQPDFQLAKNNLNWAISMKKQGK